MDVCCTKTGWSGNRKAPDVSDRCEGRFCFSKSADTVYRAPSKYVDTTARSPLVSKIRRVHRWRLPGVCVLQTKARCPMRFNNIFKSCGREISLSCGLASRKSRRYIGILLLMDAMFNRACTQELVVQIVALIAAAVTLRFVLFGASGVASHKGAYGALFKVRCMVVEHMAHVPLGALNERCTGDIKTVLNEDIEKLELFLAHNLPGLCVIWWGRSSFLFT